MENVIIYLFCLSCTHNVVAENDWTLVFKVATGGVANVLDLYTGSATLNVDNYAAQSLTAPTADHFKSDIINNWSTAGITQVRLSVYRDGAEVAFFLFNGTGSDKMNWMSQERLINSSYTDMKDAHSSTPVNFFSIQGSTGIGDTQRIFYISSTWGGCPVDSGWIGVVDTNSLKYCQYEFMYNSSPMIIYSPLSTSARFENDQETTTQINTSPTLSYTPTVSISQLQLEPTTAFGIDQNVGDISCSNTCSNPNVTMYCCACEDHPTFSTVQTKTTSETIDEKIQKLKTELTVNKKNTTMFRRSLTSIYESRMSAVTMGSVGVAIIASVIAIFAVFDCMKVVQCRKNVNNRHI